MALAIVGQLLLGAGFHSHAAARSEAISPALAEFVAAFGHETLCLSAQPEQGEHSHDCDCCVAGGCQLGPALCAPSSYGAVPRLVALPRASPTRPAPRVVALYASDLTSRGPPAQA